MSFKIKYQKWFQKKPSLTFGDDINSMPGVMETPIVPPTKENIQGRKLHLKETLKRNQLHFQGISQPGFTSVDFFYDNSLSVQELISIQNLNECSLFLSEWFHKSNIRYKSISSNENKWDNSLWEKWLSKVTPASDKVCIIVSDFAGFSPSGDFWKHISAHTYPIIVWLKHPIPIYEEEDFLLDIEQKNSINIYKEEDFKKRYELWHKEVHSFLINYPGYHIEIKENHLQQMMTHLLNQLTD